MKLIYSVRYEKDEFGRLNFDDEPMMLDGLSFQNLAFWDEKYQKLYELECKTENFIRLSKAVSRSSETDLDIYRCDGGMKAVFYCENATLSFSGKDKAAELVEASDSVHISGSRAEFMLNIQE